MDAAVAASLRDAAVVDRGVRDAGLSDQGDAQAVEDGGAGQSLPPPLSAEPCGEDLMVDLGRVSPPRAGPAGDRTANVDLAEMGPFSVFQLDATIDNPDGARPALSATFYAPSDDGGNTALAGPFPLIIVMPGFGTNHYFYEHFTRHLASHGLLALGLSLPFALQAAHDRNADEALAALDYALGSNAPSQVRGRADPTRVAAAGHSFGGKIAFFAAALDRRIGLVVGWDPSNAGGPPCFIDPTACNDFPVAPNCAVMDSGRLHQMNAEVLIFRAAPDGANPEPNHNAEQFFRGSPAPATMLDYGANAAHGDWANASAAVIRPTRRVHTALLLARLSGVTGLDPWLPGGGSIGDGPGLIAVRYKP